MSQGQILVSGGDRRIDDLPRAALRADAPPVRSRRRAPQRHRHRDPALPALGCAVGRDRAGRVGAQRGAIDHDGSWARFAGLAAIFAVCFTVGLMSLVYFDPRSRRRKAGFRSLGAAADRRVRGVRPAALSPAQSLSLMIATGIGLHNFSEGLAIGQSAAAGDISLALVLVIGFGLHNATEGFGIVGPFSGSEERPSWGFLGARRADRRRADVLRHAARPGLGQRRRLDRVPGAGRRLDPLRRDRAARRLPQLRSQDGRRLGAARSASCSASRPTSCSSPPAPDPARARTVRRYPGRVPLASVYPLVSSRARRAALHLRGAGRRRQGRDRAGAARPQRHPRRRRRDRRRAAGRDRARPGRQGARRDPAGARRPRALGRGLLRHDACARARARRARCAGRRAASDRRPPTASRSPERRSPRELTPSRRRRSRGSPPGSTSGAARTSCSSARPGAARPRCTSRPARRLSPAGSARSCSCRRSLSRRRRSAGSGSGSGTPSRSSTRRSAQAERRDERDRIARGEARIVVGARSAIFAPMRDLGLVIVDEEHDSSYKQESDPRYDARTVAAKRAALEGAVAVYGSATPRPESWATLERIVLSGADRGADAAGAARRPSPRGWLPALGAAAHGARPACRARAARRSSSSTGAGSRPQSTAARAGSRGAARTATSR